VTDEPRIFIHHIRAANLCARGARVWAARNGIDWSDFLNNGVPVSRIAGTDALGDRVVAVAVTEQTNG
jgi:hypothetical protein